MSLPNNDPSLPSEAAPIFADTDAGRGDHLRANNQKIWQNLQYLDDGANITDASAATPVDTDQLGFWQVAGTIIKKVTFADFFLWLIGKIYALTGKTTPADADQLLITDSAASNVGKSLTLSNLFLWIVSKVAALSSKATPVDADSVLLIDSEASNAGKRVPWANIVALLQPVGTVITTARTTAPTGYLACNGANVSRSTYAALFSAIGITYGAGDGSTTFTLPDLRGLFVRGAGAHGTMTKAAGGAFDGGSVGATSNDSMQGHYHNFQSNGAGEESTSVQRSVSTGTTSGGFVFAPITDGTNGTPRTGNETKPASMSLLYCIKY